MKWNMGPWLWLIWILIGPATGSSAAPGALENGSQSKFLKDKLEALDQAVSNAIAESNLPGGVLWLEHHGAVYPQAYGSRAVEPAVEPMTADTIFDAASLTKVIATTPAILRLVEQGLVELDKPVQTYLPEFGSNSARVVTVKALLTHTSGLRAGLSLTAPWTGYSTGIQLACAEKPQTPPGTEFRYSDINFIVLGEMVRRVSGRGLDVFAAEEIFQPLRMVDTGFLPRESLKSRIAPTERAQQVMLRGQVHDPTARRMGGVAGHAGVFTTAKDLARFARMMLNLGELDGTRLFLPETVRLMTSVQSPAGMEALRGLGWDINSPYAGPRGDLFPIGSYGHTGWTGTSLWIDPLSQTFLIFLSNRNHPAGQGTVVALRKQLGTLAAQATGFTFPAATNQMAQTAARTNRVSASAPAANRGESSKVLNGVDALTKENYKSLRGLRVGLVTNHSGTDRRRVPTLDLLHQAQDVVLKIVFSPEHGLRGTADSAVPDSVDSKTGLPVISLYGDRKAPAPDQLKDLDALVFDIQDIGCRFYTYIATLRLCMASAAQAGLRFIVLDRVNPLNGLAVEGPVYKGESTFVACHALPLRHGMTVGELAGMFKAEQGLDLNLTIVPLIGWKRHMWFDETGLPWINPSPNIRNLTEAMLYPGIGLLESALSVGRGTDTPFEIFGAPYVDDSLLAHELNGMNLPGVRFVPIRFTPTASTFAGQECGGVYVVLTDRQACPVVDLGLSTALILQKHYPSVFNLTKVGTLLRDPGLLGAIQESTAWPALKASWHQDLEAFKKRRAQFLLY